MRLFYVYLLHKTQFHSPMKVTLSPNTKYLYVIGLNLGIRPVSWMHVRETEKGCEMNGDGEAL